MDIKLTSRGVEVNGHLMAKTPSKKAIADQLKYMLFGTPIPDRS